MSLSKKRFFEVSRAKYEYVVFALILILLVWFSFYHAKAEWTQGDEPHYLVITQSLINDHDLNLKNNYANHDYFSYHNDIIDPHIIKGNNSGWYPLHGILLSIISVPGFLIDGKIGVMLTMSLLSFILLVLIYQIALRLGASRKWAVISVISLTITDTYLMLATSIYPDYPMALLFAILILLMFLKKPTRLDMIISGCIMGIALFLHVKTLILFAPILLLFFVIDIAQNKNLARAIGNAAWVATPYLIFLLLLALLNKHMFNSFSITANIAGTGNNLFQMFPFMNILKSFTDQEMGLLMNIPIFISAIVSLFALNYYLDQKLKLKVYGLLAVSVIYYSIAMTFPYWSGAYAPPSRYLGFVFPLLIPILAVVLTKTKSLLFKIGFFIFTSFQLIFLYLFFLQVENPGYPSMNGISKKLDSLTPLFHHHIYKLFPSFFGSNNDLSLKLALFYFALILIAGIAFYLYAKRERN